MQKERYTEKLLRLIDGTLAPHEEQKLRSELARSEHLRDELKRLQAMQEMLRDTAQHSSESALQPFFADRLMRKLTPSEPEASPLEEMAYFLSRLFKPVVIAGLFVAICLAVYNLNISNDFAVKASTAEAILALPPVNTMSVYDLDLYASDYLSDPSSFVW